MTWPYRTRDVGSESGDCTVDDDEAPEVAAAKRVENTGARREETDGIIIGVERSMVKLHEVLGPCRRRMHSGIVVGQ